MEEPEGLVSEGQWGTKALQCSFLSTEELHFLFRDSANFGSGAGQVRQAGQLQLNSVERF